MLFSSTGVSATSVVLWAAQNPPPPPSSPPYVPPSAGFGTTPPSPKRGFPWLWLLLGCGCLVILAIVAAIAIGAYFFVQPARETIEHIQKERPLPRPPAPPTKEQLKNMPPKAAPQPAPTPAARAAKAKPPVASAIQPARHRAIAKALSLGEQGWIAKVVRHSSDWRRATIAIGPPQSEWVGEVDLRWNDSRRGYDIITKRAYPSSGD